MAHIRTPSQRLGLLKTLPLCLAAAMAAWNLGATTAAAANPTYEKLLSADAPASQDSALTGRYRGAAILSQTKNEFDALSLPAGPAMGATYDDHKHFTRTITPQGMVTRTLYVTPPGRSTLEVLRNHYEALVGKGFIATYGCAAGGCGDSFRMLKYAWDNKTTQVRGRGLGVDRDRFVPAVFDGAKDIRYLLLRKGSGVSATYVALFVGLNEGGSFGDVSETLNGRVTLLVEVVEPRAMDHNIVVVDATVIGQSLASQGSVSLYGLYFDTDKASLQASSKGQLAEMARFLKANPAVRVFIVGHTDNQGALDHNLQLADARAKGVAAALTADYGVDRARIIARGAGPLAPVASNRSDAGRAKNRRVELVEQ